MRVLDCFEIYICLLGLKHVKQRLLFHSLGSCLNYVLKRGFFEEYGFIT